MGTITFDTHQFAQKLTASGMPEKQAEAITEAFRVAHIEVEVATKQDVTIAVKELEAKIAETKAELIRWVVGAGFLQAALITALLLKLVK